MQLSMSEKKSKTSKKTQTPETNTTHVNPPHRACPRNVFWTHAGESLGSYGVEGMLPSCSGGDSSSKTVGEGGAVVRHCAQT